MIKDHFTELLLVVLFLAIMGFVIFMSHVHNDSLASKILEFGGQVLGALFLAMRGVKSGDQPK